MSLQYVDVCSAKALGGLSNPIMPDLAGLELSDAESIPACPFAEHAFTFGRMGTL